MAGVVFHPRAKKQQLEDGGSFTGGGRKFLVHTTEGTTLESAFDTVRAKRSSPHFILEVKNGKRRLVQCIPINRAARGLEHRPGTQETNHANCIQVEVVGFTDGKKARKLGHPELWVPNWSPDIYKHLHLLMQWAHKNFGVPMRADHPFPTHPGFARLSGPAFIDAAGLVGHCHAANNDHVDPGPLNAHFVINGPVMSFGPTHHSSGQG
jgi:hypothetical protein